MTPRILLCDDEAAILRDTEFRLRRAGYEVEIAGDGEEAWEMILARRFNVLVTDWQMPRLDGMGLVDRMRQRMQTQDLPVIMLTSTGFELSRDELAQRWGVVTAIPKPFGPHAPA